MKTSVIIILVFLTSLLNGISLSEIENQTKIVMKLNKASQLIKSTSYDWSDSSIWINNYKYDYKYSTDGYISERLYSVWQYGNWENNYRWIYKTNPEGLITEVTAFTWYSYWVEAFRYLYFYNSSGLIYKVLASEWDGSGFMDFSENTYTYDEFGNNTEIVIRLKIPDWVNYLRTVNVFTDGLKTESIVYGWNNDLNTWDYGQKYIYEYTESQLNEDISYRWSGEYWYNWSKNLYFYNTENSLSEKIYFLWNQSDSVWVNSTKYRYTYDEEGNEIQNIVYEFSDPDWIYSTKTVNEFEEINNIENEILTKNTILFQNYPNPFNPTTDIKFSLKQSGNVKLSIFNSRGELVKILYEGRKNTGTHTFSFDAKELHSGLYFYKLITDDSNEIRKMILLR
jgi:hypothetical protein